jgi:hypothetical protein
VGANARVDTVEAVHVRVGAEAHVCSFVILAPGVDVADVETVAPFTYRTR